MSQSKSKSPKKVTKKSKPSASSSPETKKLKVQTPEDRVTERFSRLSRLVRYLCEKHINGIAVFGERGLGKSTTIRTVLDEFKNTRTIKKIKGKISPLQVYNTLFENNDEDCIIWFDDCDSAFSQEDAMNILKAAMDTDEPREISWNSNSTKVAVPEFRFRGRVIVSTNVKLARSEHLEAFLDRMHWCETFLTQQEKLIRIEQISKNFNGITPEVGKEILEWIKEHVDIIGKKLSLRTFGKLADLTKFMSDWKEFAIGMIEQEQLVESEAPEEVISAEPEFEKKKSRKEEKQNEKGAGKVKGNEGNYPSGSLIDQIFNTMKNGKVYSIEKMADHFDKSEAQIKAQINRLIRHGKRSGKWTLTQLNSKQVQMKVR